MGTRADFYKNREPDKMEWLGSIAWDGYPEGIDREVLEAKTEEQYEIALKEFFNERNDVTLPDEGWPWPWDDSQLTDYSYAFENGKVLASPFGHPWFDPLEKEEDGDNEDDETKMVFPNMKDKKNVRLPNDPGSGIMIFTGPR